MKKKIFIVVGIILLIGIIYFVCFYRGTTEDNKKTLTVAEEITLNDNEKELLEELVNVNNKLLNPKQEENTNTTDYVEVAKPTEPIALKDFCKKIYEARKTTNEQGETIYLFDMDTMGNDNKIVRRIFITKNGEMTGCTFVESDYEKAVEEAGNTTADSNGITLGGDFVKAIFEGTTKSINEMWDKATVYENVNYDNILSKI